MKERKIRQIVGTGGIGKGLFFLSHEKEELGRNESRMAELSDAKDYCKLHIVFHYLGILLAPDIDVVPIGKIGIDENGYACRTQMEQAGMNTKWVRETSTKPTMLSVCIQYPDKNGCNITSDNSACQEVDAVFLQEALKELAVGADTIAVAVPEVPLGARIAFLQYAKEKGAFCAASCPTAEIEEFVKLGGPGFCDLIALNQEETAAFARMKCVETQEQVQEAAQRLLKQYPTLHLWLTLGAEGSLLANRDRMLFYSALPGAKVVNTGGAGDASLAGLLTGYCLGLPLCENQKADELLGDAGDLAVLLAGMSVESPDSINRNISWDSVRERAGKQKIKKEELID